MRELKWPARVDGAEALFSFRRGEWRDMLDQLRIKFLVAARTPGASSTQPQLQPQGENGERKALCLKPPALMLCRSESESRSKQPHVISVAIGKLAGQTIVGACLPRA